MKNQKFNPKKYQKLTTSQKLNAMVRRATQQFADEREEEPTMRFSTAFIIVFVLQAVAIGGIVAFNQIHKSHQPTQEIIAQPRTSDATTRADVDVPQTAVIRQEPKTIAPEAANHEVTQTSPLASAHNRSEGVQDSGKVYVVAKGDIPERIAKKFRVSYDDLLKLNKIVDPRRLQIGQKLHIPVTNLAND